MRTTTDWGPEGGELYPHYICLDHQPFVKYREGRRTQSQGEASTIPRCSRTREARHSALTPSHIHQSFSHGHYCTIQSPIHGQPFSSHTGPLHVMLLSATAKRLCTFCWELVPTERDERAIVILRELVATVGIRKGEAHFQCAGRLKAKTRIGVNGAGALYNLLRFNSER